MMMQVHCISIRWTTSFEGGTFIVILRPLLYYLSLQSPAPIKNEEEIAHAGHGFDKSVS